MQKFLKSSSFKLRFAKINHALFLHKIYNDNVKKNNFFNTSPVLFKNHVTWLKDKIKKKSIFIIYSNNPIGYVRIDKIGSKKFSISIAMKNNYKNKGIAKNALLMAINKIKVKKAIFIASIKRTNKVSQKFFINCGFKKIRNTKNYIFKNLDE